MIWNKRTIQIVITKIHVTPTSKPMFDNTFVKRGLIKSAAKNTLTQKLVFRVFENHSKNALDV